MATWTTTEAKPVARTWLLTVWDCDRESDRLEADGGSAPTPADYIAALRAETEEVRADVLTDLAPGWAPGMVGRAQNMIAELKAECHQARADLATVTAERDSLRARLDEREAQFDRVVAAIAAEDEPAGVGCSVSTHTGPGVSLVWFTASEVPFCRREKLWSPLPRVLAEIARSQPGALLAAADKLRPVATTDRETRAWGALRGWTQQHGLRWLAVAPGGRHVAREWNMGNPIDTREDTALDLCARLGIEVE